MIFKHKEDKRSDVLGTSLYRIVVVEKKKSCDGIILREF